MKKLIYLIIIVLISGLILTGCSLLSNISQVPATGQSGITYLTKSPGPGLVGLWHFDEGSGATASDSSGNLNDGTLMGGTGWTGGMSGQALSFDGINDYVDCGSVLQLDAVGEFTVEFWIWVDILPFPTGWQGIIARGNGTQRTPWIFSNQNNSNLYIQFETIVGGVSDCSLITDDLTAGQWNHVAFTWDGGTVVSYIDGLAGPTDPTTGSVLANTDASLKFGYIPSYAYFDGLIDEVSIWDEALTDEQIGDISPPEVTINAPADGGFYPVGAVPLSNYTVVDANSYTVVETGYSTEEGMHTYTVTATDVLGYIGSDSVTYYVLENFVTGGGKINMSTLVLNGGKKAALTFAGTIGVLEGEGIVGQFQIVDHTGFIRKGAVSWHCNNDFSLLNFEGEPAESPETTHDTAIFEGDFVSNLGDTETLKFRIIDNGEPGAGVDTFSIWLFDDWLEWTIDGGNFQVHDII